MCWNTPSLPDTTYTKNVYQLSMSVSDAIRERELKGKADLQHLMGCRFLSRIEIHCGTRLHGFSRDKQSQKHAIPPPHKTFSIDHVPLCV
jgi:hypothetical protein